MITLENFNVVAQERFENEMECLKEPSFSIRMDSWRHHMREMWYNDEPKKPIIKQVTSLEKLKIFFAEFLRKSTHYYEIGSWFYDLKQYNIKYNDKNPYTWCGNGKEKIAYFNDYREIWFEELIKYDKENNNEEIAQQQLLIIDNDDYLLKMEKTYLDLFLKDANIENLGYTAVLSNPLNPYKWIKSDLCCRDFEFAWRQIVKCVSIIEKTDFDNLRLEFMKFLLHNHSYYKYWKLISENTYLRHHAPFSYYHLKDLNPSFWISNFRHFGDSVSFDELDVKWKKYVKQLTQNI